MVNNLIFFLRNKFIFHGLNVAAKISFQKREIKKFRAKEKNWAREKRRKAQNRWKYATSLN